MWQDSNLLLPTDIICCSRVMFYHIKLHNHRDKRNRTSICAFGGRRSAIKPYPSRTDYSFLSEPLPCLYYVSATHSSGGPFVVRRAYTAVFFETESQNVQLSHNIQQASRGARVLLDFRCVAESNRQSPTC